MYLDFEDDRPETPRVHTPISRFRGIELSLGVHAVLVALLLFGPARASTDLPVQPEIPPSTDSVRFVHMVPLVERQEAPVRPVEHSDLDRRSRTVERPKDAKNSMAFSRGNSPEKVIGAPEVKPGTPDSNPSTSAAPPAPNTQPSEPLPANPAAVPIPIPAPSPGPASESTLGQSLRDLRRYLQKENFDNQRGGFVEDGPQIQFDSKGVEFGPWVRRFIAQVKSNWYIPQAAGIMRGRVVLQFYIEKNGAITDLKIVSPSGVESFNHSSFNAIRHSNPTLPLPAEYPLPRALFTVTFSYNERLGS